MTDPAPPEPVDLDETIKWIRQHHYNSTYQFARGTCAHCCGVWPCRYARLVDEVERLRGIIQQMNHESVNRGHYPEECR